jgi:hypothetical protein
VVRSCATLALLGLAAGSAVGQGLPPYQPINPLLTARSGLYFQPYVDRAKAWDVRILTDYASLVEFAEVPGASMVIDAEILRLEATITRNLGNGFVGVSGSMGGAYDGFGDGILDWYHKLTGLRVKAREIRPKNVYGYDIALPNGDSLSFPKSGSFLGDLRLVAGHRHTRHWQSVVSVTVPTGPEGFGRKVGSISAITTVRSTPSRRVVGEFSAGVGYTPATGPLRVYQETDFHHLSGGVRLRFWGRQTAFVNLFYQSRNYQATTMRTMDQREITLDYGFLLKAKKGPEWFLGMTEDLEPKGPAIDLSLRIGARW